MPPELRTKMILNSTPADPGWHLELDCKHTVWSAVNIPIGRRIHCALCVDAYHKKELPWTKKLRDEGSPRS